MKIKRFSITAKDSKRILSIGVKKVDKKELIRRFNDVKKHENTGSELNTKFRRAIVKILQKQIDVELLHVDYKFAYCITNGEHNDKFDTSIEDKILKGRIDKNPDVFIVEKIINSDELVDVMIKNYMKHIIKTKISKFRNNPIGRDYLIEEVILP